MTRKLSAKWWFWTRAIICIAATIALIWAPFGFAMGGLIEEWDLLGLATKGINLWWISPSSPLSVVATRPLFAFPNALAHFLSPDSFTAWHILNIVEIASKGFAVTYLVQKALRSDCLALLGGVIAIIFPADTMTIALRGLHINFAMALVLIGACLNVADLISKTPKYFLSLAGLMCSVAALLMYEAAISLIILPILVLFIRLGYTGTVECLRLKVKSHVVWFASAAIYITYIAIVKRYIPESYQASIFPSSTDAIVTLWNAAKATLAIGYPRLLWDGWRDGAMMLLVEFSIGTAIPLLFVSATLIWLVARAYRSENRALTSPLIRSLIAGLVIMAAGYAPFALLPSHQAISQRTFLWGAIGSSFFTIGALGLIWQRHIKAAYLAFMVFTLPALAFMLVQHDHYVELSNNSKRGLRSILAEIDPAKTNVVIDKTNSIGHTWNLLDGTMQLAITYLRDTPRQNYLFQICRAAGMEWQHSFPLGRRGECRNESNDWRFVGPTPVSGPGISLSSPVGDVVLPKDQAHIIAVERIPPDMETITRHDPTTLSSQRRIASILDIEPSGSLWRLLKSHHGQFIRWSFGDWWSLEKPIFGAGWREAEWGYSKGFPASFAWAMRNDAMIDFEFHPVQPSYPFRIRFNQFINSKGPSQFEVFINDRKIDLTSSEGIYSGVIPPSVLVDGSNQFRLKAPVDTQNYGLSAMVDWFEVGERPIVTFIKSLPLP